MEKLPRDLLLKILIEVNDVSKMTDQQLEKMSNMIEKERLDRKRRKKKEFARNQVKEALLKLNKIPLTNNFDTLDCYCAQYGGGLVYKGTFFPYLTLGFYDPLNNENILTFFNKDQNVTMINKDMKNDILNSLKTWSAEDFSDFNLLFTPIFQTPICFHLDDFFLHKDKRNVFVDFLGKSFL